MSLSFVPGKGTIIEVALLQYGVEIEPTRVTSITVTSTADIAKAATTIPIVTALAAGVLIPANSYLGFTDSAGKEVLVQLSADAKAADTSLTVFATPALIAESSASAYPLRLRARTEASIDRQGKRTSSVVFDDGLWERGLTTAISGGLKVPGNWSQLDPAYKTLEYAFENGLNVYAWVTTKAPNPDYSTGEVFKGVFNVANMPVQAAADGIIKGDIDLTLSGQLYRVDPTPTA